MKPAMYIFVNKGLGMSTGKTAAQVAHAAVEAFSLSCAVKRDSGGRFEPTELMLEWYKGGHYAKYVMECRDRAHLLDTERYLKERGFKVVLIIDEGHTEVDPIVPTALGVALVDKDDPHTAATFSSFRLYRDKQAERKRRWFS
jgi:peptidyl-tRNA hydrolase